MKTIQDAIDTIVSAAGVLDSEAIAIAREPGKFSALAKKGNLSVDQIADVVIACRAIEKAAKGYSLSVECITARPTERSLDLLPPNPEDEGEQNAKDQWYREGMVDAVGWLGVHRNGEKYVGVQEQPLAEVVKAIRSKPLNELMSEGW